MFIMRGAKFDVEPTKNPPFSYRHASDNVNDLYCQIHALHKKDWFGIDIHGQLFQIPYKYIKNG